jgi:hypothetical protein
VVRLKQMAPSSSVEDLYRSEGPRLWRSVMAFAGDREITDDAVSEAFMQLLGRGDNIRDPARWVWRAAFKRTTRSLSFSGVLILHKSFCSGRCPRQEPNLRHTPTVERSSDYLGVMAVAR